LQESEVEKVPKIIILCLAWRCVLEWGTTQILSLRRRCVAKWLHQALYYPWFLAKGRFIC